MPTIHYRGRALWLGKHRRVGFILYDPFDQNELTYKEVKLFKLKNREFSTFLKDVVRTGFQSFASSELKTVQPDINFYLDKIRLQSRCHKCGHDLFEGNLNICFDCNRKICLCGTCECQEEDSEAAWQEHFNRNIEYEMKIQQDAYLDRYGTPWTSVSNYADDYPVDKGGPFPEF
ncbi:hypothetical protein GCM10027019_18520 [Melaminivora jejuensis]|uniref:hypothetical protein n=1 Tax=Melaminivora jejuensis TaxID=1267217 RepID=UPI001AE0B310|nr:hypothetical protein [Melaminivora jejuensis]UHJ65685.1 hypothetical protein LVC68_03965 [Melaminivora jejuensis]